MAICSFLEGDCVLFKICCVIAGVGLVGHMAFAVICYLEAQAVLSVESIPLDGLNSPRFF